MYYIGIDSGSTNCKLVLYDNEIIDTLTLKTSWNPKESALSGVEELLTRNNIDKKDVKIIVTGYGREIIDFADTSLTEITCHAIGGHFLDETIDGIIDIGGQDCKVIQIKDGKVVEFLMNDKCAAGTGSFLNMTCNKLDIELNDIDMFIKDDEYVNIVSMCAVFAESEIVGHLASMVDRSHILLGVIHSIAARIKQMLAKANVNESGVLLITGGLAQSRVVCNVIEQTTNIKVHNSEYSIYAGAIGAAIHGSKKYEGVM